MVINVHLTIEQARVFIDIINHLYPQGCFRHQPREGSLMVTVVPAQQQEGVTDCGVYSIAAAYNAALGMDLRAVTYNPV